MRRSPITRRTSLKQGIKQMARSELKRAGRVNPISEKRKSETAERREVSRAMLSARPFCELGPALRLVLPSWDGCQKHAGALHELQKRSAAGSIVDPINLLPSCWPCNGLVEDAPAEAWRCGLVLRPGDTYEDLSRRRARPETHEAWLEHKNIY